MSLESLLVHQVTIARNTPQPDGQGGFTSKLVAISTQTACRVSPLRDSEIVTIGQRFPKVVEKVFFPGDIDVKEGDVLIGTFQFNGTLRVENVRTPSKPGHHLEVFCERIAAVVVSASIPPVQN